MTDLELGEAGDGGLVVTPVETKQNEEPPARTAVGRIPELVKRILLFIKVGSGRSRPVDDEEAEEFKQHRRALASALQVSRVFAASAVEVIYESWDIDSPDCLAKVTRSLAHRRRRLAGIAPSGEIPRSEFLHWMPTPTVRELAFSRWHFVDLSSEFVHFDPESREALEHLRGKISSLRRTVNAQLFALATELATGQLFRGQVTRLRFPEPPLAYVNRNELHEMSVMPSPDDTSFEEGRHFQFENTRFDFLATETFAGLIETSHIRTLDCGLDIGLRLLGSSADAGRLSNLESLSLASNVVMAVLPHEDGEFAPVNFVPPMIRSADEDGDWPIYPVPLLRMEKFWSKLTSLRKLDLGARASPFGVLTAVRYCPNLAVLHCMARRQIGSDLVFHERAPGLDEITVELALELGANLVEANFRIEQGNRASAPDTPELWESLGNKAVPSKLRSLKIEYGRYRTAQNREALFEIYDPSKTAFFLERVFRRAKDVLTKLELVLPETNVVIDGMGLSSCTALEDFSLSLESGAVEVMERLGPRFVGFDSGFSPGEELEGSRRTLRRLSLSNVCLDRLDRFKGQFNNLVPLHNIKPGQEGSVVVLAADLLEFPLLERLELRDVHFNEQPAIFWLGHCPSLKELELSGIIHRLPPTCPILGMEANRLVRQNGIVRVDGTYGRPLQLSGPASLTINSLRGRLLHAVSPIIGNVVKLSLVDKKRSIPGPVLGHLVASAPNLDSLHLECKRMDMGVINWIDRNLHSNLRSIYLVTRDEKRFPFRPTGLAGFLRRMSLAYNSTRKSDSRGIVFTINTGIFDHALTLGPLDTTAAKHIASTRKVSTKSIDSTEIGRDIGARVMKFSRDRITLIHVVETLKLPWICKGRKMPDVEQETWELARLIVDRAREAGQQGGGAELATPDMEETQQVAQEVLMEM